MRFTNFRKNRLQEGGSQIYPFLVVTFSYRGGVQRSWARWRRWYSTVIAPQFWRGIVGRARLLGFASLFASIFVVPTKTFFLDLVFFVLSDCLFLLIPRYRCCFSAKCQVEPAAKSSMNLCNPQISVNFSTTPSTFLNIITSGPKNLISSYTLLLPTLEY